jgi:hypothetical protein
VLFFTLQSKFLVVFFKKAETMQGMDSYYDEREAEKSCFRCAPVTRIVLMSFGGDYGHPPKTALCFVNVKNLSNPPAALRRHNGTNKVKQKVVSSFLLTIFHFFTFLTNCLSRVG